MKKLRLAEAILIASVLVISAASCLATNNPSHPHQSSAEASAPVSADDSEKSPIRVIVVFSEVPADGESDEEFFSRMLSLVSDRVGRDVQSTFNFSVERYSSAISVNQIELRKLKTLSFISEITEQNAVDPPRPVDDTKKTEDM